MRNNTMRLATVLLVAGWIFTAHSQLPAVSSTTNLSIEALDGTMYNNVRLKKKTPAHITFYHSAGVCTIAVDELTDASRGRLGLTNAPPNDRAIGTVPAAPQPSSKTIACNKCGGARTITCPTCRGGGFGPDKVESSPCPKCGGDGVVTRRRPLYENSGGAGKRKEVVYETVEEDCRNCKGAGALQTTKRAYCSTCNGHGSIPCPVCSGR